MPWSSILGWGWGYHGQRVEKLGQNDSQPRELWFRYFHASGLKGLVIPSREKAYFHAKLQVQVSTWSS